MAREYAKKFYSSKKWQDCRNAYASSKHYLCERCLAKGLYRKGAIVHHKSYITPDNIDNPNVTLNWDNLELVCRECHEEEHEKGYTREHKGRRYSVDDNGNLVF